MALAEAQKLKKSFLEKGGSAEAFEAYARGGLNLGDGVLQDAASNPSGVRIQAERALLPGKLIKYLCYDGRGRDQGWAICRFEDWKDSATLTFEATHLVAEDPYYEWWASQNLRGHTAAYHLCEAKRRKCPVHPGAGGEGQIHVTQWQIVGANDLFGLAWASDVALKELEDMLIRELANPVYRPQTPLPEPVVPPPTGPLGSGLDDAHQAARGPDADADDGVDQLLALSKQALRGKTEQAGPKEKKAKTEEKRKSFGGVLAARASERQEVQDRSRSRKKAPRGRKTKEGAMSAEDMRKLKSKPLGADSSSDEGSDSAESSPDFRVASSREVDLVKLSKQNPGCLLRSALKEMSRYLAARGEAGREDPSQGRVLGYLHQILLPQYPKAGIRNQRELTTVATALDFMLEGELGRAGDLLAQRFKALEASLAAEGSWSVARHHELIPGQASLSTKAEQTEAAKAELRASKLRQALHRGSQGATNK